MLIAASSFPQGAGFDFTTGVMPAGATISRAAGPWSRTQSNRVLELGSSADTPRFDYDAANARINYIRNSEFIGAVPGTPGTFPTFVTLQGGTGLTTSLVAVGTDTDGERYIDYRISGTNNAANTIYCYLYLMPQNGSVRVNAGQVWTFAADLSIVAGSLTGFLNTKAGTSIRVVDSANAYITETTATQFTSARNITTTMLPANANQITATIQHAVPVGNSVDLTIRIKRPQLEMSATATAYIPTNATTTVGAVAPFLGLLVEPASTNYATAKVPASASGARMTVTTGIDDPANTTTGIRMTVDGTTDPQIGFSTAPNQAGRTFTRSMFLRDGAMFNQLSRANLYDYGTSGAETPMSTSATTGPTWNRFSGTRTFNATMNSTLAYMRVDPFEGTGGTNQPLVNSSMDTALWQYEEGSKLTSYIPTTNAAATRPAETLVLDWASRGVMDGPVSVLVAFDNATTQTVPVTVQGGLTSLTGAALNRNTVRSVTIL